MIKTFLQYNESISEDLSLSDFLYMHLEDVKVWVDYGSVSLAIDKIENEFGVQNFIDDYISLAKKNNQWVGGPLNKEWANKYYEFFGLNNPQTRHKPMISISFRFYDGSGTSLGFSLLSKKLVSMDWSNSSNGDSETISAGEEFHIRDTKKSKWADFSYDIYYDIIHRILPNFTFNWEIDTIYNN